MEGGTRDGQESSPPALAAESETARNAERFRALLNATAQMVWTTGPDGLVDDLPEWRAFTGQSREEVRGTGWADAIHPDDRAATLERWREATSRRGQYQAEYRVRAKDGTYRWYLARGIPILDADGGVREWVGTWSDVTEPHRHAARREHEYAELARRVEVRTRELTRAQEWAEALAALLEALQGARGTSELASLAARHLGPALRADHIVSARVEGERLIANAYWGNVPESVLALLAPPGASPEQARVLWGVVCSGQATYSREYRALPGARDLADVPPLAVGYEPVKDAQGRVVAVFGIGRHPSEGPWLPGERNLMRRAAASIALAHERAETTARLAAQNRELEARNDEQETFVYTVSHDLRQPLLSIQGMSDLLAEAVSSGDDREIQYLLGRISRNVARMSDLLNDLLTLSRVGRSEQTAGPVPLASVMVEAVAEVEGRLEQRGVNLELPDEWPMVHYEPTEALQVVGNLLGNAVKWAGANGEVPRVRLSTSSADRWVTVTVEDNGPGIPPRHRERVFGLFQKLDSKAEGTGVGLAILKRIVERHGGTVWIDDSPLGGAAFHATMPQELS